MPEYVVRLMHTSDQCPSANSKVRARVLSGHSEMQKLAQQLGIKFLAGPLVITSEHVGLAIVEADRIEAVEEFVMLSGLMQWNSVSVSAAKPLEQAMKDFEKMPPPIY